MSRVEVIDWIDYKKFRFENSVRTSGGFFALGMRWDDYINQIPVYRMKYAIAMRERILEDRIKADGLDHQRAMIPVFSNGRHGLYTFRAWGDLLAATWSEEEDKDYCYMDFYYIADFE